MKNNKKIIIGLALALTVIFCICLAVGGFLVVRGIQQAQEAAYRTREMSQNLRDLEDELNDFTRNGNDQPADENTDLGAADRQNPLSLNPISIELKKPADYSVEIADNKDCESIAAGVTRYAYKPAAQGEISTEMMYITHKQLATTGDLKASFDELNDYLSGGKRPGEMDLGEPEAFRFYCSGAAHGYVTDFGAYYPGVDQAKAVILLSGQAVAGKYNQQSLTYNIFARKGDHLLMIQYVDTVDEVLSPTGESKCLENVSGSAGLNWSCVAKEINSDLNATGKIKSKVNELISHFELKQ